MAQLDLNSIYQYYIDQGATPTEAAQYTVYYIPYGQKKSFTGISTPKFKTSGQFESEYAPNYTKFKTISQTANSAKPKTTEFWKAVIAKVDAGGTYLDLQELAYGDLGEAYADENNLIKNGYVDTATVLSSASKVLNEKTAVLKAKAKQDKSLDFYASSIGAPSTKLKYGLVADKANNIVVFKPAADIYTKATKDFKTKVMAAKVEPTLAKKYYDQFDAALKSGLEQAITKSNRSPFTDAAISRAGK
jgi:hypothetical protein